tara:strand:- start:3909 stop:4865 length:957 start_codon:yes stop_codon:yes gene_type:complete
MDTATKTTNKDFSSPDLYKDASGKGAMIAKPTATSADANRTSVAPKPSDASPEVQTPEGVVAPVPFREHMETLFDGENLTEDFMTKAEVVFEAAVGERVSVLEEELKAAVAESYEEELESFKGELVERIDDYLNYVVEEWMQENELAVETGVRSEVAESFIEGLKNLFETNYIDIPEERVDILEKLVNENEEVNDQLNEAINTNIELSKDLLGYQKAELFSEVANDLSDVQIDRFASLAEGIEFESAEQFADKLVVLKESYFGTGEPATQEEEEVAATSVRAATTLNETSEIKSPMDLYVNTLSRQSSQRKLYDKNTK